MKKTMQESVSDHATEQYSSQSVTGVIFQQITMQGNLGVGGKEVAWLVLLPWKSLFMSGASKEALTKGVYLFICQILISTIICRIDYCDHCALQFHLKPQIEPLNVTVTFFKIVFSPHVISTDIIPFFKHVTFPQVFFLCI